MPQNTSSGVRNAVVLTLCAALVGLAIGAATHLFSSDDDTTTNESEPTATMWQTQPGQTQAHPSPDGAVPPAAEQAAARAVELFTEYGYTDHSPDAWVRRLAKVSTDGYAAYLTGRYLGLEKSKQEWDQFVKPDREAYRTRVSRVELETSGLFTNTEESLTFTVTYRTSMRSKATGGEWTDPPTDMQKVVTVQDVDGQWLVNDVRGVHDQTDEGQDS